MTNQLIKKILGFIGIGLTAAVTATTLYLYNPHKDIFNDLNIKPFHNQKYTITMQTPEISNSGETNLTIKAGIKENHLVYGIYSQSYTNKITPEEIAIGKTDKKDINGSASKIFVMHPREISIGRDEQRSYQIKANNKEGEWGVLIPYEENERAKNLYKYGEKVINKMLSKIGISEEDFQKFVNWYSQQEKKSYEKSLREIKRDFQITEIKNQLPEALRGYIETAREGVIEILSTKKNVQGYLVLDPFLGNSSREYGKLEKMVCIPFTIKDTQIKDILRYFPDVGWKDKNVKLEGIEKTKRENPEVLLGNQTEIHGDKLGAYATYQLEPTKKGNETLRIEVYEFDSQESFEKNTFRLLGDDYKKGISKIVLRNSKEKVMVTFYLNDYEINSDKKESFISLIRDYPEKYGMNLTSYSYIKNQRDAHEDAKQEIDSYLEEILFD